MSTYPSTNPNKRDHQVKAMLTPATHANLHQLAEAIGQTPSTLASFAIGIWVNQQINQLGLGEKFIDKMVEQYGPDIQQVLALARKHLEAQ